MQVLQRAGAALIITLAGLQTAAAAEWRFCIAETKSFEQGGVLIVVSRSNATRTASTPASVNS